MKIYVHAHVLPREWPDFNKMFGYDGFVSIEHYGPNKARLLKNGAVFRDVQSNCFDDDARLQDCLRTGVDIQVLSTVPVMFNYWAKPEDALFTSQYLNNDLAKRIAKNPKKSIGLGTLPMQAPKLAATELIRLRQELHLAGVQIGSHIGEINLDSESLYPIYEAAEATGAAIMVHPWDMMGKETMKDYWLPWLVGMPAETTRAMCSMIFGGIFDRFPKLRVLFAHGGGSFAHTIGRIEHGFHVRPDLCQVKTKTNPREYLGRFYVDSITHEPQALRTNIEYFGLSKVALGSDYPFPLGESHPGKMIESMDFSMSEKQQLYSGTALEWLGLAREDFI